MLFLIWIVVCLVVVAFILLLPALWRRTILNRYSGSRPVTCPETRQPAVVGIDCPYAAAAEMDGRSDLRLRECTRWPERAACAQECLSQAIHAEPYTPGKPKGPKQIYHLPIALAAFVAWCLGALWHSQHFFRARWMDALGLTPREVKQMVWWLSPHLLTAAVCLLFAYGVAWLLAVSHRRGVLYGALMSLLLCAAVAAASSYAIARIPHELLAMEAGYIALAALTMGAIVGGLYDKLVLPAE
jgi:hypothetical protein